MEREEDKRRRGEDKRWIKRRIRGGGKEDKKWRGEEDKRWRKEEDKRWRGRMIRGGGKDKKWEGRGG